MCTVSQGGCRCCLARLPHLSSGILHGHPVGAEPQVGHAPFNFLKGSTGGSAQSASKHCLPPVAHLAGRVVKVPVQDLLTHGQRAGQAVSHNTEVLLQLGIVNVVVWVKLAHRHLKPLTPRVETTPCHPAPTSPSEQQLKTQ